MDRYHLYMDETGQFEAKGGVPSRIVGVLVPEGRLQQLRDGYDQVCKSHLYSQPVHARDVRNRSNFSRFTAGVLECLLAESGVITFSIVHQGDIYADNPAVSEVYAANRFLNMAQAVIEHVLFLHPPLLGVDLRVEMHPNSRICRVDKGTKQSRQFSALGFHSIEIGGGVASGGQELYFVWNSDALRSFLHRMAIDYSLWASRIGQRKWSKVETVVAERSPDQLVQVVDILAAVLGWESSELVAERERLAAVLSMNLVYGKDHQRYKELARLYLADSPRLVVEAMRALRQFTVGSYYRWAVEELAESAFKGSESFDLPALEEIEREAREIKEASRGDWGFVREIVQRGLAAMDGMPAVVQDEPQVKLLRTRLIGHLANAYNHRGEYGLARDAFAQAEMRDATLSLEDCRERFELTNLAAVADANVFAFEQAERRIVPLISVLERSLQPVQDVAGTRVRVVDPLLGWLEGTLGQSLAFQAPQRHEKFPSAEHMFLEAASRGETQGDLLRHQVNLLHLYLDWERIDKTKAGDADSTAQLIVRSPLFSAYLEHPAKVVAGGTQYALAVLLKHAIARDGQGRLGGAFIERLSRETIGRDFDGASGEHPFQFIFAYLGMWRFRRGEVRLGRRMFEDALSIQRSDDPNIQPTFHALRVEIHAWWASKEARGDGGAATAQMCSAVEILGKIGKTPELAPMLSLDEARGDVRGWFADAWHSLQEVDRSCFSQAACDRLLAKFTFNYR